MYYLHEQRYDENNMQTTIIRKFKCIEKAKQKKLQMEKADKEYWCNYFITKLI